VFKVSVPRADLQVIAAGVTMNPAMGLNSYAAFMKAGSKTIVMVDTALLEDQVNPVMGVALDNGAEVTALHNRFFWDSSKVMFMHIGGMESRALFSCTTGASARQPTLRRNEKLRLIHKTNPDEPARKKCGGSVIFFCLDL
jgi:hypothetical protein